MIKKNSNFIILAILALFALIAIGTFTYSNRISEDLTASTLATLNETTSQQQYNFDQELTTELEMLESVANTLVIFGYDEATIRAYLTNLEFFHKFRDITVSDFGGIGLMKDGSIVRIGEEDYFKKAMEGEMVVTDPQISQYSDQPVIILASPIWEYGEIVGVVSAEYELSLLSEMLLPTFSGNGDAYVFTKEGYVVASTLDEHVTTLTNLFDDESQATFTSDVQENYIENQMLTGSSGTIEYYIGDDHRVSEYRPTSHNDWIMLISVPSEIISGEANSISTGITIFNIFVVAISAALLIVILLLRRNSIHQIEQAAYYDDLTGIRNLVKFKIDAYEILKNNPDKKYVIVKLDVVNFKVVNEIFSFEAGNELIRAIADVSREITHEPFICGRVGTDEFLLFSDEIFGKQLDDNLELFQGMFRAKVPFISQHHMSFRHGRYFIDLGETDMNAIIAKVTLAHSFAKDSKETIICDYNEDFKRRVLKAAEIGNKMEKALANNEFKVFLQPKYRLSDNLLVGAEALVRWIEPDGKMIYPNDFIPLFEQNGFIVELDKYMLAEVCKVIKKWIDSGKRLVPVSVNFSRLHLENHSFVQEITEITDKAGVPRHCIEIELTESTIIDNESTLTEVLEKLHKNGFKLSMDDFGTGYSSLGLLKNLNVDVIKLDRSFFYDVHSEERGKKVVESMVGMAQKLEIETVAEGVETAEHVEFLKSIDCQIGQGYFYAKPMPAADFK